MNKTRYQVTFTNKARGYAFTLGIYDSKKMAEKALKAALKRSKKMGGGFGHITRVIYG